MQEKNLELNGKVNIMSNTTSAPKFSIIVPTLNREDTLKHCLETIISQPGDDYEIIVSDNYSGPETAEVVKSFKHIKTLFYFRTPQRLSMRDNYEFAINQCSGRYITIIGDCSIPIDSYI